MSTTTQIYTDAVIAFPDDQHSPHDMAATQGDSDVDECQRILEAAEKMKASLILVNQTLVSLDRLSSSARALRETDDARCSGNMACSERQPRRLVRRAA